MPNFRCLSIHHFGLFPFFSSTKIENLIRLDRLIDQSDRHINDPLCSNIPFRDSDNMLILHYILRKVFNDALLWLGAGIPNPHWLKTNQRCVVCFLIPLILMIICNIGMINRPEIYGLETPELGLSKTSFYLRSVRDPWTSLLRAVEKSKFGKKSFIGSRKRKITKVSFKSLLAHYWWQALVTIPRLLRHFRH